MMAKKKTIRTIPQARTPMPEQAPEVRVKNFDEVACGYRLEDALVEAERCLDCADQPCVRGCPVGIDIPGFIKKMAAKNFHGAYDVITDTNLLPSVCGRVCPQENQCEGVCTVGETLEPVAIGRLERFVGDMAIAEGWANIPYIEPNRFKVGIVGSGPAGMACAADMAKAGCEVIVYEAFHEPGGVLKYGIPDFRLPNSVVDVEIEQARRGWASSSSATRSSAGCSRSSRCSPRWASTRSSSAPARATRASWASRASRSAACCRPTSG